MIVLRPDQTRTVDLLRVAAQQGPTLCVGPTGFGKGVLIAEIARRVVELGGSALVVVHRLELVQDLAGRLRNQGLRVSEIHPGAVPFPAPVQVASVQTLLARGTLPPATVLIWDEAHHILAEEWARIWRSYPGTLILGFTATPMLADGTGLGAAFSQLVVAASKEELRAAGVLVPCEVFAPEDALASNELAWDPVLAYQSQTPGEQAIFFERTVEIAIQRACVLRGEGIPAAAVWGDMPTADRERAMKQFQSGELRCLTNVALLTEGFNHPPASVAVLCRRVGHLGLYDQMVGRVLRAAPGKTRAVLLDAVGATHMHGPPDEERRYSLLGRGLRRAVDVPDVRFCPVCGSVVTSSECEECGHAGEMRHRPPRVLGLPVTRFAKKRQEDDEARALTLSRWMAHARSKGWKSGHALHRYRATYGAFPSRSVQLRALSLLT